MVWSSRSARRSPLRSGCVGLIGGERARHARQSGLLRPQWGDVVAEWACPVCGTSCDRTYRSGRARVYCTNACRQRAYRLRRRTVVAAARSAGRPTRPAPVRATHTRPPARPALRRRSRGRPPRLHGPPGHRVRGVRTLHAGSPVDGLAHGFHRRRAVVLPNVRRGAARRADPRGDDARAGPAVRRGPPQRPLNIAPCSARLQCSHGEQQTAPGNPS